MREPRVHFVPNANGEMREDELSKKWFKYCQTEIPVGRAIQFGRDELTHYYYAQAVFNLGGNAWSDYRTAMFDHLQSTQNKDGSWPARLDPRTVLALAPSMPRPVVHHSPTRQEKPSFAAATRP